MSTPRLTQCACRNMCPMPTASQWVRCSRCGAALTLAAVPPSSASSRSPWPYPLLLAITFLLGTVVPAAGFVAFALLAVGGVAVVLGRLSRSLAAVMFDRTGSKEQLVPWAILDIGAGVVLTAVLVVTEFTDVTEPRRTSSHNEVAARDNPPQSPRVPVQMDWDEYRNFVAREMPRVRVVDMRDEGVKLKTDGDRGWVTAWFEREGDDRPFRTVNLGEVPVRVAARRSRALPRCAAAGFDSGRASAWGRR